MFDVVVGNPPYANSEAAEGRKTATKPLWFNFSEVAFNVAEEGAPIAFITPSSWMLKTSNIHSVIATRPLISAKVFSKSPFPGVGTTVSYWIASNVSPSYTNRFTVETDRGESVDVSASDFISAEANDIVLTMSVLAKTINAPSPKMDVRSTMQHHTSTYKHRLSDVEGGEFLYPVFHTNTNTLYSSFKDELHTAHKVLISKTGSLSKARVDFGSSVSQIALALVTNSKQEAEVALFVLQSKLYRFIVDVVRTNSTIPSDLWRALPAVDLTRSWTDVDLYAHFGLSQDEIDLIEESVK